jgi:phosphatidylserine/phosphatidylglycerophosphate/cardiolipin synthase-like enzyme
VNPIKAQPVTLLEAIATRDSRRTDCQSVLRFGHGRSVTLSMAIAVSVAIAVSLAIAVPGAAAEDAPRQPVPQIDVYFSPKGGCMDAILKEIKAAKSSVLVQAYWFTSTRIAKALAESHKRGVKVEVILDLSRAEIDNAQADYLVENGVPTAIDDKHVTAHNKVIIIDGQVVITGSFNFTEQSETANAENLLVVRDKAVAEKFTANWKDHRGHSGRYGKQ